MGATGAPAKVVFEAAMARQVRRALLLCFFGVLGCAHAPPEKPPAAEDDVEAQDRDSKLERLLAVLSGDPSDPDTNYNVGLLYQLKAEPALALRYFEAALKADPGDWNTVAKLVQVNQALGRLAERDRWRAKLLATYRAGKLKSPPTDVYCRDQFRAGKRWVIVLESFELRGPHAVRYSFNLLSAPQGGEKLGVITLSTDDEEEAAALKRGEGAPGERRFILEGAFPDGAHERYGVFNAEPAYDTIRTRVGTLLEQAKDAGAAKHAL
jgi:tetratricopeptide (TPR) repeat protein